MSAASSPIAARAITASSRRARSDRRESTSAPSGTAGDGPLRTRFEHVARLPHRLDEWRTRAVELAAKVAHVGLDDVVVAAEVVSPNVLEDLSLRENATRVEHEEAQERKLR